MLESTNAIVARAFPESGDELVIDGRTVGDLVSDHGTPIFVYSAAGIERAWSGLRAALPPEVEICYSVKANPHPKVIGRLLSLGARVEIASVGELDAALAAGADPAHIVFAGPGKSIRDLTAAVEAGIGEVHIESIREAERLSEIARERGAVARVAIRVNPSEEAQGGAMRMGGQPAPFGIDEELLPEIVPAVDGMDGLEVTGVHLFAGTQILSAETLATQYAKALSIADDVTRRLGRSLHTVDFGGGLGIPYTERDQALDLDDYRSRVSAVIADRPDTLSDTQLLIEPGRFLVGEAGVYLASVHDLKESRGSTFAVIDGGMHHHLAASGNLGQVIKRNYPIVVADALNEPDDGPVTIVGPLCTPLDTIARNLDTPALEIGDVVAVLQSGAYGLTASPVGFLSQPTPTEVWVEDGRSEVIRPAQPHA